VGIYQDMSMNQTQLEKMIGKMMNIIKPNGVSDMGFNLEPLDNNEYYMRVTYVVPDGSEFLRRNNMKKTDVYRDQWNREIKNTIKSYFGVNVVISSSSIESESYHNRLKNN
jgi:hypothetical protein